MQYTVCDMYVHLCLDFRFTFTNRTYIAKKNHPELPQLKFECPSNAYDHKDTFPISVIIDEVDDTAVGELT